MLKVIIDYFLSQWDAISSAPSLLAVTFVIGCAFGWVAQENRAKTMEERLKLKEDQIKDKDINIEHLEKQLVSSNITNLKESLTVKEQQIKDKDIKIEFLEKQLALEGLQLTVEEMELLADAQQAGEVYVMQTQAGTWVQSGNKDFVNLEDKAYAPKYIDALNLLLDKKLVRHERGQRYSLTSKGFETVRNNSSTCKQ
jgi:uncharacterized protein YjhX (UPF0386 family)/uncharacterized membrane protein YciS (DUF1049 family)